MPSWKLGWVHCHEPLQNGKSNIVADIRHLKDVGYLKPQLFTILCTLLTNPMDSSLRLRMTINFLRNSSTAELLNIGNQVQLTDYYNRRAIEYLSKNQYRTATLFRR